MSRSVTFVNDLVTEIQYIPRMSKESVPDYFYSRADIERFQKIWAHVFMVRMRQIEEARLAQQLATDESDSDSSATRDASQGTSCCSKRKRCDMEGEPVVVVVVEKRTKGSSADQQCDSIVEVTEEQSSGLPLARSVSPEAAVDVDPVVA